MTKAAGFRYDSRRLPHDIRVGPEELYGDRVLLRLDAEHLVEGAAIAMGDGVTGDHLRHSEPGAVPARLHAHEPVADAGERRKQDPVRDLDGTDPEWVCQ